MLGEGSKIPDFEMTYFMDGPLLLCFHPSFSDFLGLKFDRIGEVGYFVVPSKFWLINTKNPGFNVKLSSLTFNSQVTPKTKTIFLRCQLRKIIGQMNSYIFSGLKSFENLFHFQQKQSYSQSLSLIKVHLIFQLNTNLNLI